MQLEEKNNKNMGCIGFKFRNFSIINLDGPRPKKP